MKKTVVILIFLGIHINIIAQTLSAEYLVKRQVETNDGTSTKVVELQSNAYFYRNNNRYIYYEKPTYLEKYPGGVIDVPTPTGINKFLVPADTIQNLNFHDLDSLVRISRRSLPGVGSANYNIKDKIGRIKFNIEFLDENKTINGLFCQKALMKIGTIPQWIVWFAPSIPMDVGVHNIIKLPGLVVEAEFIPVKAKYLLTKYVIGKKIDEKVFHPEELNQPYQSPDGTLIKPISERINKQLELLKKN